MEHDSRLALPPIIDIFIPVHFYSYYVAALRHRCLFLEVLGGFLTQATAALEIGLSKHTSELRPAMR
jgi:hypothetical protein